MKAAVYGGPEVLRYEEVPEPACPPDGVLFDVEVISVEGGDTIHRQRTPFTDRPHIVVYQCAGTVRAVGPKVMSRKVGERIVALGPSGSHAEVMAAKETSTWPISTRRAGAATASTRVATATAKPNLGRLSRRATARCYVASKIETIGRRFLEGIAATMIALPSIRSARRDASM